MSTHYRTTAPMPIEFIEGIRADAYREFKEAAAEMQNGDSRRFRSLEEVRQHLRQPITAGDLGSPDLREPVTGLRQRLELGHAPRGIRERLLGEQPADNASKGLRAKLGIGPEPKTFRARIAQRK